MAEVPDLLIATDKACFIVLNARQYDGEVEASDRGSGSNPIDDGGIDVLEDGADDPVRHELVSFIGALDIDEQIELVTLASLGRGDDDPANWSELHAHARQTQRSHRDLSARHAATARPSRRGPLAVRESCADMKAVHR